VGKRRLDVRFSRRKVPQLVKVDPDPLNLSVTNRSTAFGTIWARLKVRSTGKPWTVPNEYIAAEIGRFIRLPIPPYAICCCDDEDATEVFASLWFNYDHRDPLPVRPKSCAEHLPKLVAGLLVFDSFICNADRHHSNIEVDDDVKPKVVRVFDHDVALFGNKHGGGIARLNKLENRMGITDSVITDGMGHCLIDAVTTCDHFGDWIHKLRMIPTDWLQDLCHDAAKHGLTSQEVAFLIPFLQERRHKLPSLFNKHHKIFSSIADWRTL
jgi:hypothetical protein